MSREPIAEKIKQFIGEHTDLPIHEEDSFSDLAVDSLDQVEIIFEVEHYYNIVLPEKNFESIKTVSNLINITNEIINALR